jgi:hypothetical protein
VPKLYQFGNKFSKRHIKMPTNTEKKTQKLSLVEETYQDVMAIKEAIANNASFMLNGDLKSELKKVVAEAIGEAETVDKDDDEEKDFPTGDEPEVPSDDTDDVSGELSNDVADELPSTDASPEDAGAEFPSEDMPIEPEPEGMGDEDIVDLTGASDEEVLQVFKKMGPEDEIEVVQTPDGFDLKIGGDEYIIKTGEGGSELPEPEVPEMEPEMEPIGGDEETPEPEEDLVAEGDYKQELARVKEMGKDAGNVDSSRRTDVKKPAEKPVAEVGEPSPIKNNEFENTDKRKDVSKPAEKGVATQNKEGENIDTNVKKNYESGMSDRRKDVSKPEEVGVAKVKPVPGNMSMEASNTPNYDRGTKSTPVEAVAKVTDKTTVGIAENVQQLKKKLNENHDKLVYTRQKYAEVIADNANLRDRINTLNETVNSFKKDEEEYKNAIVTLKEQFNEVALFTSNLTYAVKLMTEHATTKEEKNQILARFDNAKNLSESKLIYESLVTSFGNTQKKSAPIEEKINKSVTSGASTINESVAYQSPELARMRDLIKKI